MFKLHLAVKPLFVGPWQHRLFASNLLRSADKGVIKHQFSLVQKKLDKMKKVAPSVAKELSTQMPELDPAKNVFN